MPDKKASPDKKAALNTKSTHTAANKQAITADNTNLWGGRFTEATDEFVTQFNASVSFDQRLADFDITASIAHTKMLAHCNIITPQERNMIIQGLEQIQQDIASGQFSWSIALEDVHMNIESKLIELIGDTGRKLHTARSRNDQVATDMRLYVRHAIEQLQAQLNALQTGIITLAQAHTTTIMPGFTHLQAAQPVTFGHHLLAWAAMFERDYERLTQCRTRLNISPLGSAALAGTSFAIDRAYTAQLLNFDHVSSNSLDAVSDRDFIMEFIAHASILMVHLSRIAEELILWVNPQFGFIELPDRYCTGSSIMPQKKNPDVPELVRGKSARVIGHLMTLLTLMKGQALAYNKDNQEDKEPLFDTIDTLQQCLTAYNDMIPKLQVNKTAMRNQALKGYTTATDLAEYLVTKGVSFRKAHHIVGQIVQYSIQSQCQMQDIPLEQLQTFCDRIEDDVFMRLSLEGSIKARKHIGGTAPEQVQQQIQALQEKIRDR